VAFKGLTAQSSVPLRRQHQGCVGCENQSRGTRSGTTNLGYERRGIGAGEPGGREPPRRL